MSDEKLEDLTLAQLRGMRREIAAMLENQATFCKHITRSYEHLAAMADRIEALTAEMRKGFKTIESDIALLEIQNIARHGETLSILRKLEGDGGTE